jgi:hypothetical protein
MENQTRGIKIWMQYLLFLVDDLIKINKLSNAWKEKVKKDLGVDLE